MIKIFADGADVRVIVQQAEDPRIAGFTTNPSLMRAAGIGKYRAGASSLLRAARSKPVSIEVLSDDFENMAREARGIAELAPNAVVKVPIVNSKGESCAPLIAELAREGLRLNVTAVFTPKQVEALTQAVVGKGKTSGAGATMIVSVFAGRIGDAGVDPLDHVTKCREVLRKSMPRAEMLWASARQAYDVHLAEAAGCEIITMTSDLIRKLALRGKDLDLYSRETATQFYLDAAGAGYAL